MLAPYESGVLAEDLIATCCVREHSGRDQLTIHADRGPAMIAKPVAHLLSDLGITKSHSRPHVSNDNPYSEAHFKTLKYRPGFPKRFGSLENARAHLTDFLAGTTPNIATAASAYTRRTMCIIVLRRAQRGARPRSQRRVRGASRTVCAVCARTTGAAHCRGD
jgi:hypothetical protein